MGTDLEQLMVYLIIGAFLTLILYSYWRADKKNRHLILSVVFLGIFIIGILYLPESIQIYLFLGIIMLALYILFVNLFPAFFSAEYKKLLQDPPKSVWDQFDKPPQSKF